MNEIEQLIKSETSRTSERVNFFIQTQNEYNGFKDDE